MCIRDRFRGLADRRPHRRGKGASFPAVSYTHLDVYKRQPYRWLSGLAAPVTLIRAPSGERGGSMDFSQSPTWPGLGAHIGAGRDERWGDHSHFIPMEDPARVAALLAAL